MTDEEVLDKSRSSWLLQFVQIKACKHCKDIIILKLIEDWCLVHQIRGRRKLQLKQLRRGEQIWVEMEL